MVSGLAAIAASPRAAAAVSIPFPVDAMRAAAGPGRTRDSDGGARPGDADRGRPTVAAAAAAAAVEGGNSVGDAREEEWRPAHVGSHSAPLATKLGAKVRRRSMVFNGQWGTDSVDPDVHRRYRQHPIRCCI